MIILRGVNVFPSQIEEQLMKVADLAPHFQVELTKPDRMDVMTVITEAVEGSRDHNARAAAGGRLRQLVKDSIGVTIEVDVREPGGAPRSQGKAVRVVDKRNG